MNIVTKIRVHFFPLVYPGLTRTVLSWLLKKAVSMALWTKADLCGKSSLLEQSLPRTPSQPKTSESSVSSVSKNLCNLWLLFRSYKTLHLSRTLYKSALFLQNKPNLLDAQMNVSSVKTMNYEQITMNNANKNKPNQSQFAGCSNEPKFC